MPAYNASVPRRGDSRVLLAIGADNPPEAKVHAGSHKGRADSQAADLHEEAVAIPLVLDAHDPPHVTQHLTHQAQHQGDVEGGAAAGDGPGGREGEEGGREDGCEEDVGTHGGDVVVRPRDKVADGIIRVVETVLRRTAGVCHGNSGRVICSARHFDCGCDSISNNGKVFLWNLSAVQLLVVLEATRDVYI